MEHSCCHCYKVLPEMSEEEFFSDAAKYRAENAQGVRFVVDPYGESVMHDASEAWECEICWWQSWHELVDLQAVSRWF